MLRGLYLFGDMHVLFISVYGLDYFCGNAADNGVCGDVFGYHRASGDYCSVAYGYAREYCGVSAYPYAVAHPDGLEMMVAAFFGGNAVIYRCEHYLMAYLHAVAYYYAALILKTAA